MGWLRGSTDVANCRADLYNLITGGIAAGQRGSGQGGNAAQLTTDKWDALDGTNFVVRSPVTQKPWWKDTASSYRKMWRGIPRFSLQSAATASEPVAIGTPTFSGPFSGGPTRCYFRVWVSTANSVAGTLAGTVVTYQVINADTGATDTGSTTVSGWTGTSYTAVLKYGVSLTLTLGGSDQFTVNHINWIRGYSTTYPQGIDYFPEGAKLKTTGALVVSNSDGGANNYTLNTDFKVVQQADTYPDVTMIGNHSVCRYTDWAGQGVFSGFEWQAGGSPPAAGATYYIVDVDMYQGYLQIMGQSGGCLYFFAWDFWDPVAGKGRMISYAGGGSQYNTVTPPAYNASYVPLSMAFTNTSPTSTWFINYWLSVKTDKIVWTFRGDPGNTGVMSQGTFQAATAVATKEKSTWVLVTGVGTNAGICTHIPGAACYDNPYWGVQTGTVAPDSSNVSGLYALDSSVQIGGLALFGDYASGVMTQVNPAAEDGKWDLTPLYVYHQRYGQDTSGAYTDLTRHSGGIASKLRGIWLIANDNLANLDELVDGGSTYLLTVTANRGLIASTVTGYAAVLEE